MRFVLIKKVNYRLHAVQDGWVPGIRNAQVYVVYDDETMVGYALDFVFHPELAKRSKDATDIYMASCAQS